MMPLPGWPVMAPNAYDNNNIALMTMMKLVMKLFSYFGFGDDSFRVDLHPEAAVIAVVEMRVQKRDPEGDHVGIFGQTE